MSKSVKENLESLFVMEVHFVGFALSVFQQRNKGINIFTAI